MSKALCLLLLIATFGILVVHCRTLIAKRAPNHKWELSHLAHDAQPLSFKVLLKQRNLDQLERTLQQVSDPNSAQYGVYPSQGQIDEMVAADPSSVQAVVQWLQGAGISSKSIQTASDYVSVNTQVGVAASLFGGKFGVYVSNKGRALTRIVDEASLPLELVNHVDFVSGISELLEDARSISKRDTVPASSDQLITPAVLRQYYNMSANATNVSPLNSQGVAAFQDAFASGALVKFSQTYHTTGLNYTWIGPDCITEGENACDSGESDLDMQYITALGQGVHTYFLAHNNGEWILDWALALQQMQNPPLVNSISYGFAEREQCDVTSGCRTYGYNSTQYVNRCNVELQKIGARGLTVLVSDGDDGAPSYGGASGNCPLNSTLYCPAGGCAHTQSLCSAITVKSSRGTCFLPMGSESTACQNVMANQNAFYSAMASYQSKNRACKFAQEQDSNGLLQLYSACYCYKLKPVTSHGFTISPYKFVQTAGSVFTPDYPTSSPYVTSVGATQFGWNNGKIVSEFGASVKTGALITTGGGFSAFQPQPSYQTAAVAAFLNSSTALPPSFSYNPNMRAYPDISFNGHNYNIFMTDATDACPCTTTPVDGTSCSSPALAGLISLINGELLKAGKTPVGFLNPLLYQMALNKPSAFTDITKGDNKCNRGYCCTYGFTATAGWDPVSGLGTPVYAQMRAYILNAKGVPGF